FLGGLIAASWGPDARATGCPRVGPRDVWWEGWRLVGARHGAVAALRLVSPQDGPADAHPSGLQRRDRLLDAGSPPWLVATAKSARASVGGGMTQASWGPDARATGGPRVG